MCYRDQMYLDGLCFQRKNHATGVTKNEGLGHAFVWAYRDETKTVNRTGTMTFLPVMRCLRKPLKETDKNGFFFTWKKAQVFYPD